MNTQPDLSHRPMTLDEYLRFEAGSAIKHEFVNGEIYAFAGASRRHSLIVGNLYSRLFPIAQENGSEAHANDVKLQAAPSIIYYPDIMVVCNPDDTDEYIVSRPSLIVEVISPSTAAIDHREKLMVYRQIEGLRTYLVVEQESQRVTHHWRDESGAWWRSNLTNSEDRIPIHYLGTELSLQQIYQGIF